MESLVSDLRSGIRQLAAHPAMTMVAVISLAVGIGANTAIFSLADAVLLRSIGAERPEELVLVLTARPGGANYNFSYPLYRDLRDGVRGFAGLVAFSTATASFAREMETERVSGELVSGNYFETLGVRAALGRTLRAEDDRVPGEHPVVVSHRFWRTRLAANPAAVGSSVRINGRLFDVVGVAPAGFAGAIVGAAADFWAPLAMQAEVSPGFDLLGRRTVSWLYLLGRLRPGVSRDQARAELEGYEPRPDEDMELNFNRVGAGYFETLEISVVRGRSFGPGDRAGSAPVAIINETMARRFWPGADPIGRRISDSGPRGPFLAVGVVLGAAGALLAARALRSLLFEISTVDPVTYGAVAVLLVTVALAASWIPARRAAAVDPLTALRHE